MISLANLSKNGDMTEFDELKEIFTTIFGERKVWDIVGNMESETTRIQKKMLIKMVCDGKYNE